MTQSLVTQRPRGFVVNVQSLHEAMEFAQLVASTDMVPEADKGKPGNILAKMQKGAEIGMPPMLAIGKLYIVHGRVGMETMGMLALVEGSGQLERKKIERLKDDEGHDVGCRATVKRHGRDEHVVLFTHSDAVKAGLTTGKNRDTYAKWDWRMYQNRALGFALQDEFSDVLGGTVALESLQDAGLVTGETSGDVDGRPVSVSLMPAGDEHLQSAAVMKMEKLKLRPGQRLAKLTAYRGRYEDLNRELDALLMALPSGTVPGVVVPPEVATPAGAAQAPVQETGALPEGLTGQAFDGSGDVEIVDDQATPRCKRCGAENHSNPDCDQCLDVRIAGDSV